MCEAIKTFDDLSKLGQGFVSVDDFEEVDIGDGTIPRPMFVNQNLRADYKSDLIELLREYVGCFAWNYNEMPCLSRELVEHRLRIKPCFMPMNNLLDISIIVCLNKLKKEINQLLEAGFIMPCRYADWILCLWKKGRKLRLCIDLETLIDLVLEMNILCL